MFNAQCQVTFRQGRVIFVNNHSPLCTRSLPGRTHLKPIQSLGFYGESHASFWLAMIQCTLYLHRNERSLSPSSQLGETVLRGKVFCCRWQKTDNTRLRRELPAKHVDGQHQLSTRRRRFNFKKNLSCRLRLPVTSATPDRQGSRACQANSFVLRWNKQVDVSASSYTTQDSPRPDNGSCSLAPQFVPTCNKLNGVW